MEDFESLPEFQALQIAAAGKPERSMGESVIPAEPPAWGEVLRQAKELAKNASNQLSLHIYLIQAHTNVKGFAGFLDSLQVVAELFEQQWDAMYPLPDTDDPDDMYYERVNLMSELSERPEFLDTLYRLPLVSVRGIGEFSTRDIDISQGIVSANDEDVARCQEGLIRGAFTETDADELVKLADTLRDSANTVRHIESVFSEKAGQAGVLSLANLYDRITSCQKRMTEFAADQLAAASSAVEDVLPDPQTATTDVDPMAPVNTAPAARSSLQSRQQVNTAFDAILLYYQAHEPSSPVRILTVRAKDFVNKSFFEVIQALAPSHKEDLPALLDALQNQPLSALLNDSFARHISGESLPQLSTSPNELGAANPDDIGASVGNSTDFDVITSRDEVVNALQDIEVFFQVSEPSSPLPLIIADIRRLVPKRFSELVTEFARLLPVVDGQNE